MALPLIPQDKANHFIYGVAIGLVFTAAFGSPFGFVAAAGFGVAKEFVDWYQNKYQGAQHGVEWLDALATALGGAVVSAATYVVVSAATYL